MHGTYYQHKHLLRLLGETPTTDPVQQDLFIVYQEWIVQGDSPNKQQEWEQRGNWLLEQIGVTLGQDIVQHTLSTDPPTYSLLVSNIGWVHNKQQDYDEVLADFEDYKRRGTYNQVTMWSSDSDDPILEFYLPDTTDLDEASDNDEDVDQ